MEKKFTKIYKVYKGRIHSLEVKETPYKYVVEHRSTSNMPFGFGIHFYKQDCDTTQGGAIKRALGKMEAKKAKIEFQLEEINVELKVVKHLEEKFKAFLAKKKVGKKKLDI